MVKSMLLKAKLMPGPATNPNEAPMAVKENAFMAPLSSEQRDISPEGMIRKINEWVKK